MSGMALALPMLGVVERAVWVGVMCGYALLLLKLWRHGLAGIYPFFCVYLGFRLTRSLALFFVPFNTNAYGWIWAVSAPVTWLLYVLVVLELYSLVLRNYQGIASLGRWVLSGALALSVLISAATLVADLSNPAEAFPKFLILNAIERGVISSLAIFLLLITAFLSWYPVPLSRNVIIHSIVYSVYFLSVTMGLLVRNITGIEVHSVVNLALMCVTLACLFAWNLLLSRAGETQTARVRRHWQPQEEEHLVAQLESVNAALLRAARK